MSSIQRSGAVRNNGLRPYQVEAVEAFGEAQSRRDKLHVISLPTGSGKTRVGVELALRHLADGPRARVLWLAPRWPLVGQASDAFEEACPDAALCRIGGAGRIPLMEDDYGVVCFTTLSTWYHRHKRRILPRAAKPSKNRLTVVERAVRDAAATAPSIPTRCLGGRPTETCPCLGAGRLVRLNNALNTAGGSE